MSEQTKQQEANQVAEQTQNLAVSSVPEQPKSSGSGSGAVQQQTYGIQFPSNKVLAVGLAIILASLIYFFYSGEQYEMNTVKQGDVVVLSYTVMDSAGNFIESSVQRNGSQISADPLIMQINSSLPGFSGFLSRNVVGMKSGQEKTLSISKNDLVFGTRNPELDIVMPMNVSIPIQERVAKADFLASSGVSEVEVNRTLTTNGGYRITVLGINDDGTIDIQYIILPGDTITTTFGVKAQSTGSNSTHYFLKLLPEKGAQLSIPGDLRWYIDSIGNDSYVVSANSPFAGKDLSIWFKVEEIRSSGSVAGLPS